MKKLPRLEYEIFEPDNTKGPKIICSGPLGEDAADRWENNYISIKPFKSLKAAAKFLDALKLIRGAHRNPKHFPEGYSDSSEYWQLWQDPE